MNVLFENGGSFQAFSPYNFTDNCNQLIQYITTNDFKYSTQPNASIEFSIIRSCLGRSFEDELNRIENIIVDRDPTFDSLFTINLFKYEYSQR